jgi:hypothetical protein
MNCMKPDASIVTQNFSPEAAEAWILRPPSARREHGCASGRYDYLCEIALDYAFLLTQLGIHE